MSRKKLFIQNALILTAVSFFMRAVSFSFNVYAANKIGALGMGLYALIMSVYNFGVTFAASGINLASTKVIAEEIATGKNKHSAVKKSLAYSGFFGGLAFLLIFFGASFFGIYVVEDSRIILPLKILSLSLPCVAMSFALSGYFTATGKVYKNSIVQIAEQIIKICMAVVFLNGTGEKIAQKACIYLVTSGTVAEIVSFLMLFLVYVFDKKNENRPVSKDLNGRILSYGLPVAMSAYLRSALNTIENVLIPKNLEKFSGMKENALSAYGVVHGMVMPLLFLPSGAVNSVSILLVPEITMLNKQKKYKSIENIIERVLSITLSFSVGAAGILYFFSEELGMLFYKNHEASYYLKLVAPVAVIMYADGVVDAVLKGLNQEIFAMRYDIVLSALSIMLIGILIPKNGVIGYIAIIYISEMINAYLSISRLLEVSNFKFKPVRWAILPTAAIFVASFFCKSVFSNGILSLFMTIILYVVIILIYRGQSHTLQRKRLVIKY